MKKFSKIEKDKTREEIEKKKKDTILYQNGKMKIRNVEDWTVVDEPDMVICIPYLIEENAILIRREYVPTYKAVTGDEFFAVVMSGTIEDGESPNEALIRELEEEMGIVLNESADINFLPSLFVSKGCMSQYHPCILSISKSQYEETVAKGDGSKEESVSKAIKIPIAYIRQVLAADTITAYMLEKIASELKLNIK